MQISKTLAGLLVFFAVSWGTILAHGQEGGETGDRKPARRAVEKKLAEKKAPAKEAKASAPRLPRYYGKLGLSDAQRDKVRTVQEKYESEIDALEKQLANVRTKQETDLQKVLNADQKQQLADLVAESKAKRSKDEPAMEE